MDCVMRCAFGQVCDGVCDRAKAGNTVPGVAAAGASPERALEKQAGPGEDLQLLPWVHQREVRTKDYQQRPCQGLEGGGLGDMDGCAVAAAAADALQTLLP